MAKYGARQRDDARRRPAQGSLAKSRSGAEGLGSSASWLGGLGAGLPAVVALLRCDGEADARPLGCGRQPALGSPLRVRALVFVAPVVVAAGLTAWAGCSSSTADGPDGASPPRDGSLGDAGSTDGGSCLICQEASFPDVPVALLVQDTLDQICGAADGCHGTSCGQRFPIHEGVEFDAMINVTSYENPPMKRVLPGQPLESYVYLKLRCEGGIVGACMPLSSGFDPSIARIFHDWIEAGAPLPTE